MVRGETPGAALSSYLEDARRDVMDEIERIVPRESAYWESLYRPMREYPLRDAKMLRPALCIATCRALGGKTQAVLPTAAVLELYHNAFLIHDDIEDGSEWRRGGKTLHRTYGTAIAINVGDALLALTLQPLLDNMRLLDMGAALRILATIAEMARESAEGQALELDWIRRRRWDLEDSDYVHMVRKKSAWYSFVAPMVLGAMVAGVHDRRRDDLQAFAFDVGVAFQIRDDIINLVSSAEIQGKEQAGDLWEGKRTLIILHALREASPEERRRAELILAKERPVEEGAPGPETKTTEEVRWLQGLIDRRGSLSYARTIADDYAKRARERFETMEAWMPSSPHRAMVRAMVDFVIERAK